MASKRPSPFGGIRVRVALACGAVAMCCQSAHLPLRAISEQSPATRDATVPRNVAWRLALSGLGFKNGGTQGPDGVRVRENLALGPEDEQALDQLTRAYLKQVDTIERRAQDDMLARFGGARDSTGRPYLKTAISPQSVQAALLNSGEIASVNRLLDAATDQYITALGAALSASGSEAVVGWVSKITKKIRPIAKPSGSGLPPAGLQEQIAKRGIAK